MATKCNKNKNKTSKSRSKSIDHELKQLMEEAKKNGWGMKSPEITNSTSPSRRSNNTNSPMFRQRSISELPDDKWRESEVLRAVFGINETELPPYRNEVANMMIIEDPEIRKKGLTEDELWRIAAHVARLRRYEGEGRPIRHEDKIVLQELGKLGGKRKTKRKKTRKYRKTRKSRKAKKSRKTRKSRKTKKSRKTRKSRRSNRRKTHKK